MRGWPGPWFSGLVALPWFVWLGAKATFHGINSDGPVYLLQAGVLSPWFRSSFPAAEHLFSHYALPPLYPLLLALGGGGPQWPLVNYVLGALLLTTALVVLQCWWRRMTLPPPAALALCLGIMLSPSIIFIAMDIVSEPLYMVLTFSALVVLSRPTLRMRDWYAGAVLVGLAALTRTVGIVAVCALLLMWAARTQGRTHRAVVLLSLGPPLVWSLLRFSQGWHTSYLASLLADGAGAAWADMLTQLPINLAALWYYFVRSFDLLGSDYAQIVSGAVLLLAVLGLAPRLRRLEFDACYVVLYLAVLTLWPYPNHARRFLLPILPLLLTYAWFGGALLLRPLASRFAARAAAAASFVLLACITLPSTITIARQVHATAGTPAAAHARSPAWYGRDSIAEARASTDYGGAILDSLATIEPFVPRSGCVTATMPEFVQLYARRKSLRPPLVAGDDLDALRAHLERCPWVVMLRAVAFPPTGYDSYYPLSLLAPDLSVLHNVSFELGPGTRAQPLMLLARYAPHRQGGG